MLLTISTGGPYSTGLKKQQRGSSDALDLLSEHKSANSQLKFKDVRFTVKAKGGDKEILHGITGGVNSGEVLAIMAGPAG